jgi:hypothetical protein
MALGDAPRTRDHPPADEITDFRHPQPALRLALSTHEAALLNPERATLTHGDPRTCPSRL